MWRWFFSAAYVTTCALGIESSRIPPEAAEKIRPAFADHSVLLGLAGNMLVHAALLGLFIGFLYPLHYALKRQSHVRLTMASAMTVLTGWAFVFSANQVFFSHSAHAHLFSPDVAWGVAIASFLAIVLGWLYWMSRVCSLRAIGIAAVIIVCAGLMVVQNRWNWSANAAAITHGGHPNIFILGIDSLSMPVLKEHKDRFPHIARIWNYSQRYEAAQTPLARTCPAWMSILTGKMPAEHGAVFNLRDATKTAYADSIQAELGRRLNYRTLFALDERRFCHIDETMGFDSVVGPELGILDFVVQSINDTPLTNFILQWPVVEGALSYSHYNVASVANYSADGFVGAVLKELKGPQPIMAAVHFESAHYPYRSRHADSVHQAHNDNYSRHLAALEVVDRQVGQFMNELSQRGMLANALVVLLSDHGESFGVDYPVRMLDGESVDVRGYGHGAFLLKSEESNVVLGFAHYVNGISQTKPESVEHMVSLIDVRQQINRFIDRGILPHIQSRDCVLLETGVRLNAVANLDQVDPADVVRQAAEFYEIGAAGRMRLRESKLPQLIETKDVGLMCGQTLTLYESAHQNIRAYKRAHDSAIEIKVNPEHAKWIALYRQQLGQVAMHIRQ